MKGEIKLKKDAGWGDWWRDESAGGGHVCGEGMAEFFRIPGGQRTIFLCWADAPVRGAYRVTREDRYHNHLEVHTREGVERPYIGIRIWDDVIPAGVGAERWVWVELGR
jgi:hypothetical protein